MWQSQLRTEDMSLSVPHPVQSQSKDLTHPSVCSAPTASMVPQRKGDLASVVLRALLTGICVSMLNACLAGRSVPTASRATEIQGGTGLKTP